MPKTIGKPAIAIPLVIAFLLTCILGLAVAPLLRAEPHDVAFAIVNLDEGSTTVAGSVNVGETLTENLVSGESSFGNSEGEDAEEGEGDDSSTSSIVWTELASEDELAQALADNRFFGGIVIPENFTSQQMYASVGLGDAPELSIYLNAGKNPQMANTMRTTIMDALLKQGIAADVETVNDADVGGGSLASTIGVQMVVMPLFIMTMIGSLLTSLLFWKLDVTGARRRSQLLGFVVQLAIVVAFSAVFSAFALSIDAIAGGMTLPLQELFLFVWPADMLVMLFFVGLCDLCFPVGAVVAVAVFALGLGTAMFPAEMLPVFWAEWVYPWAPQACIGQGIRQVLYFGNVPGDVIWLPLLIEGAIGAVALLLAAIAGAIHARSGREPRGIGARIAAAQDEDLAPEASLPAA